jgi:hypothetical protein
MSGGCVHQTAVYGSDEEFLAMALPFLEGGLAAGEPVLAATTSANLELLHRELGHHVDYAESAYFGRRPPQRVAVFERYWRRHAASGKRVRILAEPVWVGRSTAEVADWELMESGLNILLADTRIWMICPYDTRVVAPAIVAGSLRTHPQHVTGAEIHASSDFIDPHAYARTHATPWRPPPEDAARLTEADDLRAVRRFVAAQATAYGLAGERAAMLVMAVNEVVSHLRTPAGEQVTVRMWARPGAITCDVRVPVGTPGDPFLGYRTPWLREPADAEGLWYARQVCDRVQIGDGGAARVHFPTGRAVEYH